MQNLINSLTKSTSRLPDLPSIQRSNSSIVPSNSQPPSLYRISGNYTFFISPQISSKDSSQLTQSNILIINAFTDSMCKYAIAFSTKWFRIINEKTYQLPINSNTFQLSAFEIGCSLKCEVKSEEDDYKGVAILTIGPIQSDEMLRNDVENILDSSQSKFSVRLVNEIRDLIGKEKFLLLLNKENMRLLPQSSEQMTKNILELQYSVNVPEIEIDYSDSMRISMIFKTDNPDYDRVKAFLSIKEVGGHDKLRLGVLFENKNIRDVFLLVIRCLTAKKYLINSKIIEEYGTLDKFLSIYQKNNKNIGFSITDILLEIEKLKRKNDQILQENKEILLENSRLVDKKPLLDVSNKKASNNSSIETSKIIEEKRLLEKKVYELESQLKDLVNPNKLFQEFDMKQSFLSDMSIMDKFGKEDNVTARDIDLESEISVLKRQITMLEAEKKELSSRLNDNNEGFELKMMNEMLKMEVNTYKVQKESQIKDINHLKETIERLNARGTPRKERTKASGFDESGGNYELAKIKESYEMKIKSLENQLNAFKNNNNNNSINNNPYDGNKLLEENMKLKLDIEKMSKESIIQRGKLISERDGLKAEIQRLSNSNKSSANLNVSMNINNNDNSVVSNVQEVDKLKHELEYLRRNSIIERGKLIEERNKLRTELELAKKSGGSIQNIEILKGGDNNEELDKIKAEFEDFKRKSLIENTKLNEEIKRNQEDIKRNQAFGGGENQGYLNEMKRVSQENTNLSNKINEKDQRIGKLLIQANETNEKLMFSSQEMAGLRSSINEKEQRIQQISSENTKLQEDYKLHYESIENQILETQSQNRRLLEEKTHLLE